MKKIRYYENLDGLRGIAALMVVICHFFLMPSVIGYVHTDLYGKITKFGQHGVSLFFVLSGFVITRILINNRNENNYFRQFYWRRALRIFPLYYLFLLCWYFVLPLIVAQPIVPFNKQFQFYLYLQNFDWLTGLSETAPLHPFHFWSLAVEEHFYLIWPLVVYLTPTQKLSKVIISIVILIIPVKIFFLSHNISINKITFTRIDQILLGSLLAYYEYTTILNEKKEFFSKIFKMILLLSIPAAFFIFGNQNSFHFIKELFKYNLLGLIFFSVIGLLIISPSTKRYNRFLESPVMQYLGKISYGIYVWHLAVLVLQDYFFLTKIILVDLSISTILTLVFAHISYFYFESKILKYK